MPTLRFLPDGADVPADEGETLLSAALRASIPHTRVCGGAGRCSTCRVLVLEGLENLTPCTPAERAMAGRLGFDRTIRLACQTRATGNVTLRRLVLDSEDAQLASQLGPDASAGPVGEEKALAILFCDIRGFTPFAESLLPYDVIHVLNRFFHHMETAIRRHGGVISNYMGDGLMAYFEGETPADTALRAVRAGLDMLTEMDSVNPYLQNTYRETLRIGIGVHYGEVVLGAISRSSRRATAIGDAVNLASRIESANKETGTCFLISEETYAHVEHAVRVKAHPSLTFKGKRGTHTLYEIIGLKGAPE